MALDAYSQCPGGTGKRIKFCCKELLGDLQQVHSMIEGGQHTACLDRIEKLQEQYPDRACLMELKCQLLQGMERVDDLREAVGKYLEKHPKNSVALAEGAMLAAVEAGGRAGMATLQHALEAAQEGVQIRVYDAMRLVAHALLAEGDVLATRALFLTQSMLQPEDPHPVQMMVQLNAAPNVPLVIKDDPALKPAPAGFAQQAAVEEALLWVGRLCWQKAADKFAEIALQAPHEPSVWHNLAALRAWVCDTPGAIEALKRYAALDMPLEDASEAGALAMYMSEDPLQDHVSLELLTFELRDADEAEIMLNSARQLLAVSADRMAQEEGAPPPKGAYVLLDRPRLEPGTEPAPADLPRALGNVLLYGRETDRAARIELIAIATRLEEGQKILAGLLPEVASEPAARKTIGHMSATRNLLRRDWVLPEGLSPERTLQLAQAAEHDAILHRWTAMRLGLLGGKTPREAAGDAAYRVPLMSAVLLLQFWTDQSGSRFDYNLLRGALQLPTLGPIDPRQTPPQDVPLVRLARIEAEPLSDEQLIHVYRRALAFYAIDALEKFSRAVIARPSLADREETLAAYRFLAEIAQDTDQALEYIERGRSATVKAKQSCASWDFMEVSVRLERGETQRFAQIIQHIQTRHLQEPGVAQSLQRLLMQLGLMRPGQPPAAAADSGLVVPGAGQAEPGKIWTPDGGASAPSGDRPKIWTPD